MFRLIFKLKSSVPKLGNIRFIFSVSATNSQRELENVNHRIRIVEIKRENCVEMSQNILKKYRWES